MSPEFKPTIARDTILDAVRRAARQEQFLEVVSAAEARRRFETRIDRSPLPGEPLPLSAALSRVIAADVIAPVDAPPFDRASVDGFAVRAADALGASPGAPKRLVLNSEVIACGVAPVLEVTAGTATAIATGGVIPRRADAVVMIEHGVYNKHLLAPGLSLVPGWRRMQGLVFRSDDKRFKGLSAEAALQIALSDPDILMVNRNAGSG